ncbi:hypothetical protein BGI41_02635 [Methanobrevibacter sp. 87.7]|uniref:metallophosphoesterase n=1 Tax=Methanobrevibacter sp. 87.7 TaxID=387957 RepID=UPI000B50BA10|nr:metallophosphoesterase [Methanobrevibacter sp. 87.7]OWT33385.1 hypothetical protein BGI41_02635 [Methanobrevibacter sp. 87.7]
MYSLKQRYIFNGPIFTIVLFVFNYYLIQAMFNYINHPLSFNNLILIVSFLAFINIISITGEIRKSRSITRFLMEVSELWKWASLMYLLEIFIIFLINLVIKVPVFLIYIMYFIVPVIGVIGYYKANRIVIKYHDLNIMPNEVDTNTVLIHISDLHIGSLHGKPMLRYLSRKLNKLAEKLRIEGADNIIVIISGDLSDGTCPVEEDAFEPLSEVRVPIIFTPGNHDYYQNIDDVESAARNAGITVLDNDNLNLRNIGLNIIGLSYPYDDNDFLEGNMDVSTIPIIKNETNVLIFHIPEGFEYFSRLGVNLQLSGHTHGGQFYPANVLVRAFYPFLKGIFSIELPSVFGRFNNSHLSVTNGVGTMGPPIRIGTDSEIIVLRLKEERK